MNSVEHVVYRLRNADIRQYPFPHFYILDVFPAEFYQTILKSLPPDCDYDGTKFANRLLGTECPEFMEPFDNSWFAQNVIYSFGQNAFYTRYPYKGSTPQFRWEWRLIRDSEGYAIGPHTDAPHKVISLLFYLPPDETMRDMGTSIFMPDDHVKTCRGGPHHKFSGFSEVWRAPFLPNSCLGFWKTDNSWHGVPKIDKIVTRNVLLYNVYEIGADKAP